jgi:RNA polymerase sigma factor (sigma-70 family)
MSEHAGKENVADLVKKYYLPLKSFIRKRVSSREDTEDILQDVFYQLIKTVDANPIEQVAGWLYRVARNTIINKEKKKREEKLSVYQYDEGGDILNEFSKILFNDDNPTPETEYLRSLVWQELETALAELPSEQREAFELTELDGLPVKEVAKTVGISVNTLLSRKHYAVKHLCKRLETLYHEMLYC